MRGILSAMFMTNAEAVHSGESIELTLWIWVIIIGAGAVVAFWVTKRVSDVVVKRKTDQIVRDVGSVEEDSRQDGKEG